MSRRFLARLFAAVVVGLICLGLSKGLLGAAKSNYNHVIASQNLHVGTRGVCPELILSESTTEPEFSSDADNTVNGLYAYAAKDFAAAQRTLSQVARPTRVDLFWLGCAAWNAGNKDEALQVWRAANADTYFVQNARSAYQNHEMTRALALYELALQMVPASAEAWDGLAQIQFDRAAGGYLPWSVALDVLEQALAAAPTSATAHYRLGYGLWASRGDWDRAEQELRWAWANDKDWLIAYALGSLLADRGKTDEAIPLLESVVAQSGNGWARYNLMRAYAGAGRCQEAKIAQGELLTKYPDMSDPLRAWCNGESRCSCDLNP